MQTYTCIRTHICIHTYTSDTDIQYMYACKTHIYSRLQIIGGRMFRFFITAVLKCLDFIGQSRELSGLHDFSKLLQEPKNYIYFLNEYKLGLFPSQVEEFLLCPPKNLSTHCCNDNLIETAKIHHFSIQYSLSDRY